MIDQRLPVIHQLFSWTSAWPLKCPIDKMIGLQGHPTVSGVPRVPWVLAKNSITETFFQIFFEIMHSKKVHCLYANTASILWLLLDKTLAAFHQLFSWTSVGPLKCPIDKMIGLQGHQTVWGVPRVQCVPDKNYFTGKVLKWISFQMRHCLCPLSKFTLHY